MENKNNTIYYLIIILLSSAKLTFGQVLISDSPSTNIINSNAILELNSSTKSKGIILPKVDLISKDNPSPMPIHIEGMIVYNLTTSLNSVAIDKKVYPGLYYNDGYSWQKLDSDKPSVGDLKYSATPQDHEGWYLLDGRNISSLSNRAQMNANNLGFSGSLPNSGDTFLKGKLDTENIGIITGNNQFTLMQANLPNEQYTGTTTSNGSHYHTLIDVGTGITNSTESGSIRNIIDNDTATLTTSESGLHNHTFNISLGGNNVPLDLRPKYLSAYIFVYLE